MPKVAQNLLDADHTVAITKLRQRLGSLCAWIGTRHDAIRRLDEERAAMVKEIIELESESEAIKVSIVTLGGEPRPTKLQNVE